MLAVMNQFTGVNGVMYYASQILAGAGVKNVIIVFSLSYLAPSRSVICCGSLEYAYCLHLYVNCG